jgi:AraC family transcriptional regulator, regulatory protein of adaptative response / DNA-3-methyladenine glycosylase II
MLPKPMQWDRDAARAGRFDGRFIVGVLSTGVYCLPSCGARPPKPENVRVLATEAEARALGFRPCKRCRPDLYYLGEDGDLKLFEGLAGRVRAAPETFAGAASLARACGVSQSKLGELLRTHAHLSPAAWLRRERVRAACRQLLGTSDRVVEIGHASGFASESAFHRQFLALTRMTPGAYRALDGATVFVLHLPAGYRDVEVLSYHARHPASPCERVDGRRIFKALSTPDGPAVLEVSIEADMALCRAHAEGLLGRESMAFLHSAAVRLLGFAHDVGAFEARARRNPRAAALIAPRRGLRLPLTPTGFEALAWAIIGQQINVSFASVLRCEILALAGRPIRGMRAHPTPEALAKLDVADLTSRRFSRSKAEYLIGMARAVANGDLAPEAMTEGSAVAAEREMTRLRGIGVWTARYMLMRGAGFADCAPVGDVALAAALEAFSGGDERPSAAQVETLMQEFSPYRSLATCHLWASLKKEAA